MPIKDILTKASSNNHIADLYNTINKTFPITFSQNRCHGWACIVKNGKCEISFSESTFSNECFFHELLHLKLILIDGFKKLRGGFSRFDTSNDFAITIEALDNELQHHKIYNQFLTAGFDGRNFYDDDDRKLYELLENRLQGKYDIQTGFRDYLSVIALGGRFPDRQKGKWKKHFRRKWNKIYTNLFDTIDSEFEKWEKTESLCYEDMLRNIFSKLPDGDISLFSYDETFNKDKVFFVGEKFNFQPTNLSNQ